MDRRSNRDVIHQFLDLAGKRVLDIGCGTGALARLMTRSGAEVTGIECNPAQLAKARDHEPAGDEVYLESTGEALPVDDGSADIAVFFNSLHHIPVEAQRDALAEAARATTTDGIIFIAEPVSEGAFVDLARPVVDETEIQRAAIDAIKAALDLGLIEITEYAYLSTVKYPDFEAFIEEMVRIDPERQTAVDTHLEEMRDSFKAVGRELADGRFGFDQPMRINILAKG